MHNARGEFHPLLHPVRKHADGLTAVQMKVEQAHHLLDTAAMKHLLTLGPAGVHQPRKKAAVHEVVAPQHEVGDDVEVLEQADVLERASNSECHGVRGLLADDVVPLHTNCSLLGVVHGVQTVEYRGLAGAVRPDDREQLMRENVEGHIRQRGDAAEAHRDIANFQERLERGGTFAQPRRHSEDGHAISRFRR